MYHEPVRSSARCAAPFWQAQAPSACAMIATAIVGLSLVPAPHPSLQPAQIHATPSIAPFARFGYATEVGAPRAAVANNASAGGGAVDATRVFADDRVGASDFIIGQEIAEPRLRPCR